MVDVYVAELSVVVGGFGGRRADVLFKYGDDGRQQFVYSAPRGEHRGHHGHAQQRAQLAVVERVAAMLALVEHIQGAHYPHVHIDELGGQIEVALQVARVNHVKYNVWSVFHQMLPHIEFLGRIGRERVGAGQVDEVEAVAFVRGVALLGIHRHARIVAHALVCPRSKVEERGLAAVGIAHQCHADGLFFVLSSVGADAFVALRRKGFTCQRAVGGSHTVVGAALRAERHVYHAGLAASQRHFVAHYLIFHGVLQRCVEHHLHRLPLDEPHLYDAFAEAAVARYFLYSCLLASLQFGKFHCV